MPHDVDAWRTRVIAAVPVELAPSPRPRIVARDVHEGADVLIYLVQWLFSHEDEPRNSAQVRRFNQEFRARFGGPGCGCDLTTLGQIVSCVRELNIRWYVCSLRTPWSTSHADISSVVTL